MSMNKIPMKLTLLCGLAVAVVLVAGCGTPAHVDTGAIKAATFSFLHPGPLPEAAFSENLYVWNINFNGWSRVGPDASGVRAFALTQA